MQNYLESVLAGLRRAGRAGSGAILFGAFVLVFASVLFLVSALQLQHSVDTTTVNGVHATLGQVRSDVLELDKYDNDIKANTDALSKLNEQRGQYSFELSRAAAAMAKSAQQVKRIALEIALRAPGVAVQTPQIAWTGDPNDALLDFTTAVRTSLAHSGASNRSIEDFLGAVSTSTLKPLESYAAAAESFQQLKAQDESALARKKDLESDSPKLKSSLADGAYRNVVDDFRAFEQLFGKLVYWIVLLPNSMLVLALSIFMGMLGSLIYLARRLVLDGIIDGPAQILFRIGLGAAVALALFFFASAGVLALSQTSAGAEKIDMSPYLISFFGITAGYLSDHVTLWMREVGEKTFKLERNAEPDRWGIGLSKEIAANNFDHAAIGTATGANADDIASWVALKRPVPPEYQKALALYLRADPSRLFTDLSPAAIGPTATASAG